MIKGLIDTMNKQYKLMRTLLCEKPENAEFKIILSATTNKAAAVLCELANDPFVRTVHSTLGLTLRKNFQTGEENLVKTRNWVPLDSTILIMDEASMLDDNTFNYLNETLIGKSKAVLIGDVFQLAPIKQRRSTMQEMLNKVPTATMSKVLRHSGAILEAATAFREVVETGYFQDILLSDTVVYVDGHRFKNEVETAFKSTRYAPHTAKVLAWSNERVIEYNAYLRKMRGLGENFEVGETVVTNNCIISEGLMIPVDSEVEITGVHMTDKLYDVQGAWLELNSKISAFMPYKYSEAKTLMKTIAKAANAETKTSERKKLWARYFTIKDTWLDLRSQYASTVHKSQGSSYDEVFIDLWDIGRCNSPSDTARMLYVALSRARHRVILSGELPAKYRSSIAA